jgi:ferredoxin
LKLPSKPSPKTYLKALDAEGYWQKMERASGDVYCGLCMLRCPAGLKVEG